MDNFDLKKYLAEGKLLKEAEYAADKFNVNVFGYQTKYYKICPGAKAFMDKVVAGDYGEMNKDEAIRLAKMHDLLFMYEINALKDSEYAAGILDSAEYLVDVMKDQVQSMGMPVADVGYLDNHVEIIKDAAEKVNEGSCGYTPDGKPRSKPASPDLMKESVAQDDAVNSLRDIAIEIEGLSDEARDIIRRNFPNELSRLEGYGVFNMIYSNNRYDVTLGKFVDGLEEGDYDDLDDEDYVNESKKDSYADYQDIGQAYLENMGRRHSLNDDELEYLGKRIVKQLYKGNVTKAYDEIVMYDPRKLKENKDNLKVKFKEYLIKTYTNPDTGEEIIDEKTVDEFYDHLTREELWDNFNTVQDLENEWTEYMYLNFDLNEGKLLKEDVSSRFIKKYLSMGSPEVFEDIENIESYSDRDKAILIFLDEEHGVTISDKLAKGIKDRAPADIIKYFQDEDYEYMSYGVMKRQLGVPAVTAMIWDEAGSNRHEDWYYHTKDKRNLNKVWRTKYPELDIPEFNKKNYDIRQGLAQELDDYYRGQARKQKGIDLEVPYEEYAAMYVQALKDEGAIK